MILKISLLMASMLSYDLEAVIDKLEVIESGRDCSAVGDGGRALGILQVHSVMVEECNRLLGREEFSLDDRKSRERSRMMAKIFLTSQYYRWKAKYKTPPPERLLACAWNTGNIEKHVNLDYERKYKALQIPARHSQKHFINQDD